jgi:hypothetical protein
MSEVIDGEPAFPVPVGEREFWDREENGSPNGMSLRDYFAAAALNGYLAGPNNTRGENPMNFEADRAARDCYKYADAMLAARKEGA